MKGTLKHWSVLERVGEIEVDSRPQLAHEYAVYGGLPQTGYGMIGTHGVTVLPEVDVAGATYGVEFDRVHHQVADELEQVLLQGGACPRVLDDRRRQQGHIEGCLEIVRGEEESE